MKRMWSKNELRKIIQETYGIDIDNLVDKNGHDRFIEGDITINEITGVTQKYGKYSLSGTHLLIVIAFEIESGTTLSASTDICTISLPQWIKDKLATIVGSIVLRNQFTYYDGLGDTQTQSFTLRKVDNVV